MSERERWIIYPLLFFALGAALRDKLLQRIESKEICCESLKIVDPQDSMRILAELGSGKEISYNPSQAAGRVGVLTIQDSDGKEACQLAKDLRTSRVITNLLLVVDPVNQQPHVIAGTEQVPMISLGGMGGYGGAGGIGSTGGTISHQGVLMLDNRRIMVRPPVRRRRPVSSPKLPTHPSPASQTPAVSRPTASRAAGQKSSQKSPVPEPRPPVSNSPEAPPEESKSPGDSPPG